MQIQKRDIALSIVLTVITCGIYGLYWMYKLTNEIHELSGKPRTADGGAVVLYTILTCSFYFYYWLYKIGGELVELRRENGLPDDSVSNKTYMIVTVIMTVVSIVLTGIDYLFQFIAATAEAAPMHSGTDDHAAALFLFFATGIMVFICITILQLVFSGAILWAVYNRKDRSPMLVYLLMALLRTYNFTIAFLQLSLNDFLHQKASSSSLTGAPAPSNAADAARVSLQKPLA